MPGITLGDADKIKLEADEISKTVLSGGYYEVVKDENLEDGREELEDSEFVDSLVSEGGYNIGSSYDTFHGK